MIEELKTYLVSLIEDVPLYVYEGLLSVFCIGAALLLAFKGKKAWRGVAKFLLAEYVFLIYCSTVLFRVAKELREYNFTPFWSYSRPDLLIENIMNVVVFVPVGFLLGFATWRGKKEEVRCKKGWLVALLIGAGLSIGIETLQLAFRLGFAEVDDVMHNTLGCVIGYGVYSLALCWGRRFL